MSNLLDLTADIRTDLGKAASRRMRRFDDKVPAVVYGAHKEPEHIVLSGNHVTKALENESVYSQILSLTVAGKQQKVILKALHRHPYKPKIMHMDFQRVSANEKLTVTVPIHFLGEDEAPGAKKGGVFSHNLNELEIRCLPANLPESIDIDVSKMEMDDVIHLTQIKVPKGVELMALTHGTDQAHDHAVVSLHMPVLQAEPVEEELEASAGEEASEQSAGEESSSEE